MKAPLVLVACERSGIVRDQFRAAGADAYSCDLEPCEGDPTFHIQGDALEQLTARPWRLLIAHPECTYLSGSGLHWLHRRPERWQQMERAAEFALALWNAPVPHVALENPVGVLSSRIRPPDQIVQPYEFGDDASKATALWLYRLPPLKPTNRIVGRFVTDPATGKTLERFANQTDSGQNKLPPSPSRSMDRARTYPGIARAMAAQWMPILASETT